MLRTLAVLVFTGGCLTSLSACGGAGVGGPAASADPGARAAIGDVLDDWHAAAGASDETRYFSHFADDGVFLGTDATERWGVAAFRAYAHPHFAASRGWAFRSVRRDIVVEGELAWFDEDLATENLGPARGSGVMRYDGQRWRIAQYNLALTIPNERFGEVRAVLEAAAPSAEKR